MVETRFGSKVWSPKGFDLQCKAIQKPLMAGGHIVGVSIGLRVKHTTGNELCY